MEVWSLEVAKVTASILAAFAGAFSAVFVERRKLDVRLEKLDQIEIEVERLTRAQEAIKTDLQGKEWNRQWLMDRKREAYGVIIGTLAEAWYDVDVISRLWDDREQPHVMPFITQHLDSFRDMTRRAMRTAVPALVFVDDPTRATIDEVLRRSFKPTVQPTREYFEGWTRMLRAAKDEISARAALELRSTTPTKST